MAKGSKCLALPLCQQHLFWDRKHATQNGSLIPQTMNQKHEGWWWSDWTWYQSIKNESRISHESLGPTDRTSEPAVCSLLSTETSVLLASLFPHFTSPISLSLPHSSLSPCWLAPQVLKISTHVPAWKEQSVSKGLPFSWNSAVPQADALQRSRVEKKKKNPRWLWPLAAWRT